MVNGRQFSWEEVSVVINGKLLEGIQGIDYTTKRDHFNIKGRGAENNSTARGQKDYSGKLTILQSEVEALQLALPPGKDLTDIEFDTTVGYVPETAGAAIFDKLLGCRIEEVTKAYKNSDGFMVIDLPMKIFKIFYQK